MCHEEGQKYAGFRQTLPNCLFGSFAAGISNFFRDVPDLPNFFLGNGNVADLARKNARYERSGYACLFRNRFLCYGHQPRPPFFALSIVHRRGVPPGEAFRTGSICHDARMCATPERKRLFGKIEQAAADGLADGSGQAVDVEFVEGAAQIARHGMRANA